MVAELLEEWMAKVVWMSSESSGSNMKHSRTCLRHLGVDVSDQDCNAFDGSEVCMWHFRYCN